MVTERHTSDINMHTDCAFCVYSVNLLDDSANATDEMRVPDQSKKRPKQVDFATLWPQSLREITSSVIAKPWSDRQKG